MIDVSVELDDDEHSIIQAKTFVSNDACVQDFIPSDEYLQTILIGPKEHHFPPEYVDQIVSRLHYSYTEG